MRRSGEGEIWETRTADVRQEDACPISSDSKYSRGEEQYDDCRRSAALSALKFLRAGTGHGKEMFEARTIAIEAHIPEQLRHPGRQSTLLVSIVAC